MPKIKQPPRRFVITKEINHLRSSSGMLAPHQSILTEVSSPPLSKPAPITLAGGLDSSNVSWLVSLIEENVICSYCGNPFMLEEKDQITLCSECQTPHHVFCWTANGGCTVLGCRNSPGAH